jgi:acyl carrier protein
MTHSTSSAFTEALCAFINEELPALNPRMVRVPGVTAATPLFATGLIDSLAILHLIGWVERATGAAIRIDQVVMRNFETVAAITARFGPAVVPSR